MALGNGTHLAHCSLQHLQEQQGTLSAQPSPKDFLCVVLLQEPLQCSIQAVLKEEAGAAVMPAHGNTPGWLLFQPGC